MGSIEPRETLFGSGAMRVISCVVVVVVPAVVVVVVVVVIVVVGGGEDGETLFPSALWSSC